MKQKISILTGLYACLVLASCAENSSTPASPSFPTLPDTVLVIKPRSAWDKSGKIPVGLTPHTNGKITNIVIHHTGPPNPDREPAEKAPGRIASIHSHHTNKNGWRDIAYHYFIATDGTIYAGRDEKFQTDSGAKYPLDGTLTITIMGNYSTELPPSAVLESLVNLIRDRQSVHRLKQSAVSTHKGAGGETTCPGPIIQTWFDTTGKQRIAR